MLTEEGSRLYLYVVTRDYGFAPNPFHGVCTLATCKPVVRKGARVGDWVMGLGGVDLGPAARKCVYLMQVSEKLSFDQYWESARFSIKKPVRNGSLKMLVGDNIYHRSSDGEWQQADSHHSNADGSPNYVNLDRDTGTTDQVLISDRFLYFGAAAIDVDFESIDYRLGTVGCSRKDFSKTPSAKQLVEGLLVSYKAELNYLQADPVDFENAHLRVDQKTRKLT